MAKKTTRKPNAAFMKPVTPDATLAAVVGSNAMPRTELTKKLWAYIKKNGLQDAKNKRMIKADAALIKAELADTLGNLTYRKTARNFAPIMASAAKCTVVQVRETVDLGQLKHIGRTFLHVAIDPSCCLAFAALAVVLALEAGDDAPHVVQREFAVGRVRQHAAPGVENHHRLGAGFDLGIEVVGHRRRRHVEDAVQQVGAVVEHGLDGAEIVACSALDHIAGEGVRAAGETDERHAARERAPDRRHAT